MTFDKAKLGAGATLVALGGIAAVALGQSGEGSSNSKQAAATAPVEVRTQVIRQTVRVVRHEKPRHRRGSGSPARGQRRASAAPPPSPAPAATAPLRPRTVAVTRTSGAPAAPAPHRVTTRTSGHSNSGTTVRHVTTRTSGGSGGEHEHESEHGDD